MTGNTMWKLTLETGWEKRIAQIVADIERHWVEALTSDDINTLKQWCKWDAERILKWYGYTGEL